MSSTPHCLARSAFRYLALLPKSGSLRSMSTAADNPGYGRRVENSNRFIDLRSDTVTLPSEAMRRAMSEAVLGDDVYGEDPTVNALEERCARLFNKDAGLFVASGTMGNFHAVLAHCQRGDEIIVGRQSHIHRSEQGNYAQFGGVSATVLQVQSDGTLDLEDMREAIRENDPHQPTTKLICLENTHNYAGGKALSLEYIRKVRSLADEHGLKVHIDGARFLNAAVALGLSPAELAAPVDSLQLCFSKGLGAPVGSILVGTTKIIEIARRRRKAIGGGWRQAGVLAAACHVALDEAENTIKRDHANADRIARELNSRTPEKLKKTLWIDENGLTNIVFLNFAQPETLVQFAKFFKEQGILVGSLDPHRARMIPHWNITDEDIDKVLDAYSRFVAQLLAC